MNICIIKFLSLFIVPCSLGTKALYFAVKALINCLGDFILKFQRLFRGAKMLSMMSMSTS